MSPSQFLEAVERIKREARFDNAIWHVRTDELMQDLLRELGYEAGIEAIENGPARWYE